MIKDRADLSAFSKWEDRQDLLQYDDGVVNVHKIASANAVEEALKSRDETLKRQ